MDREVTALASVPNGLLIFMRGRVALLMGDNRLTFVLRTVSNEKGTRDSYSVQSVSNGALFFSDDGLCITDGASVVELSYDVLGPQKFNCVDSTVTNRSYYALLNGYIDTDLNEARIILRYDFGGATPVFSFLSGDQVEGLGLIDGKLAHASKEILFDTLGEGSRTLNYKSGNITEGMPTMIKEWDRVRVSGAFIGLLTVRIDDVIAVQEKIFIDSDTIANLHIPKHNNKGKALSFELLGAGQVNSIEYSITERKVTK